MALPARKGMSLVLLTFSTATGLGSVASPRAVAAQEAQKTAVPADPDRQEAIRKAVDAFAEEEARLDVLAMEVDAMRNALANGGLRQVESEQAGLENARAKLKRFQDQSRNGQARQTMMGNPVTEESLKREVDEAPHRVDHARLKQEQDVRDYVSRRTDLNRRLLLQEVKRLELLRLSGLDPIQIFAEGRKRH